ncbi:serine hydrolase [Microbulbifer bruguierae]|uniref:Serine hydrolase n=1 Tax=Microbulbifer bruguierae TaxID=3029061 RepID=A0ABY8NJU9_9GAMM|nr:serine hydrolase [Microbulbifer bruguierae]WGL17883.1 serine hydrolase [Microbulbifer bruguierae]
MAATMAYASTPAPAAIDRSVVRAMEIFHAPGMAVSVVYDGKLYYSEGHGVTEVGKRGAVTEQTLFQIASVSKAFTNAALAILVDDGKLGWDTPVIDYLPEFQMYDPWVTREFTVRDLVTHRSGLPLGAGDLLIFPEAESTSADVVRAMRHLKPKSSFRSGYDYDNLLYIVAGEVVSRVSGIPFEQFVEQRLLFPLGMKDCRASLSRTAKRTSKATPHLYREGKFETTASMESELTAAAGGINCSAESMTAWMNFLLNNGVASDGKQLLSSEQVAELFKPVTITTPRGYLAEHSGAFLSAYALGWNVSTFYGQPIYTHSGGLWGMTSYIALMPKQGLAVFASNNAMTAAPLAVVNDILDQFLSGSTQEYGKDWIAIIDEVVNGKREHAASVVAEAESSRVRDSAPSLPLDAYVGTYRDPWYGDISIGKNVDGELWFSSGRSKLLSGPLEHFQFNTFIARWETRSLNADAYVSFTLTPEGGVERIRMKAVSPATDFSFDFHDLDLVRVAESGVKE